MAQWIAEYRIEPFGEERADLRSASEMSLAANLGTDPKKKRYSPEDFLLRFEQKEITPNQLLAKVKNLQMTFGGSSYKED